MICSPDDAPAPSVLIVDACGDTRDVLRIALERRGVRTWDAAEPVAALEMARRHRPRVVVLDLDDHPACGEAGIRCLAAQLADDQTPLVLLGSVHSPRPGEHVVRKPYHFAPLVRKIEELIECSRRAAPSSAEPGGG